MSKQVAWPPLRIESGSIDIDDAFVDRLAALAVLSTPSSSLSAVTARPARWHVATAVAAVTLVTGGAALTTQWLDDDPAPPTENRPYAPADRETNLDEKTRHPVPLDEPRNGPDEPRDPQGRHQTGTSSGSAPATTDDLADPELAESEPHGETDPDDDETDDESRKGSDDESDDESDEGSDDETDDEDLDIGDTSRRD